MADILQQLTCSLSLSLLGRDGDDKEHLSHDLHKYFRHFGGQRNLRINPKAFEEALNALKQFDERIVARPHIFCRLCNAGVNRAPTKHGYGDMDRKEYPNPSKDSACRRECLDSNVLKNTSDGQELDL